ncbi:hypothetical protein DH2020_033368 [Rehmannia glutinosa]|uniref:Lipid desaturase domain-containing protein n=1 Tax=Rehmannia glutinosa TaxID=99300 RepID=A0ABR0VEA6_REHGL
MAHQHNNISTITSTKPINDENYYKATWAHRAWFATGCTAVLISLAKSILIISKMPPAPKTCLHLTLAAALGYLLSDLVSGIYHWAVDNYGSAATPIFGSQIESFRAHHQHPSEITKCETAGILYTLAAVTAAAATPVNVFSGDPVLLGFVGVFAGCSMFSIKFHAWAHVPRKRLPAVVAALQDAGILMRLSQHAPHHRPPYNSNYCTVSGIWNRVLDETKVLAAVEAALYRVTGVRPRSWSEPISEWTPRTQMLDETGQFLNNSKTK